jgi:O-antigen ligase
VTERSTPDITSPLSGFLSAYVGFRAGVLRRFDGVRREFVGLCLAAGFALSVLGADVRVAPVYLLGWGLLLCGSVIRPKWGLLLLLGVVLVFSEEVWQAFLFGGQTGAVPATVYTIEVFGLKVQWALAGGVVFGGLLRFDSFSRRRNWAAIFTLSMLLAADVWGEVWGRAISGYSAHLFGQWALIAAPILVALAALALLDESDVNIGWHLLLAVATAHLVISLIRYGLGGGDWSYELRRRVVLWDTADGFVATLVAIGGLGWLLGGSGRRLVARFSGAFLFVVGVSVVVLSFRRDGMLALAASAVALLALVWRPRRKVVAVGAALIVAALLAIGIGYVSFSHSLLAERVKSMNPLDQRAAASATNAFHIEDIREAILDIAERPWTGWGFHTVVRQQTDYFILLGPQANLVTVIHDMYLDVWLRLGVVGFVALCGSILVGWRNGMLARSRTPSVIPSVLMALLAGYAVAALAMPIDNSNRMPYLLLVAVAALTVLRGSDGEDQGRLGTGQ